jgi:transcriptional regulator with PAS, ATPase and Fis domain
MCRIKDLILRYSPSGAPILIQGESGTGKELVARAVHEVSGRSGPLVPINCGAIPETLLESELFGSVRGAYTDAVNREGAFEQANHGSLFLDEIGEMPLSAQVKLLRVLEEKQVRRLGGRDAIALNVRILAATQRDLKNEMKSNRFREDLYYRLGVLRIGVPPLRERLPDLGMLSVHFLHKKRKKLAEEALAKLMAHDWPGNVRELRNVMERAALISEGKRIQPKDILFD